MDIPVKKTTFLKKELVWVCIVPMCEFHSPNIFAISVRVQHTHTGTRIKLVINANMRKFLSREDEQPLCQGPYALCQSPESLLHARRSRHTNWHNCVIGCTRFNCYSLASAHAARTALATLAAPPPMSISPMIPASPALTLSNPTNIASTDAKAADETESTLVGEDEDSPGTCENCCTVQLYWRN